MKLSIEGIEIVETTPIQGIVHCDPSLRHASKQNPSAIRLCSQRDGVGCEARDWKKTWKIWEFKIPHLNLQDHITQVLRSSSWKVTPVRQEDNGFTANLVHSNAHLGNAGVHYSECTETLHTVLPAKQWKACRSNCHWAMAEKHWRWSWSCRARRASNRPFWRRSFHTIKLEEIGRL